MSPSPSPSGPTPCPGLGGILRKGGFLDRYWRAVAAISGIIVVGAASYGTVAFHVIGGNQHKSDTYAASTSATPRVTHPSVPQWVPSGSCNALGQGNTVSCVFPPISKSLGSVSLEVGSGSFYLFAGSAKELPIPPDYPKERESSHCSDWGNWLSLEPRIYEVDASVLMRMNSGDPDLVVVHKVEVQVISHTPLTGDYVLIFCNHGSGLVTGNQITVDTRTNATVVRSEGGNNTIPMPPASLSLNGRGYDAAAIYIKSNYNTLYSGKIIVHAAINGQEKTIEVGSLAHGFNWVGGDALLGQNPVSGRAPAYDWDIATHKWVLQS